jgi:hypothetical protein
LNISKILIFDYKFKRVAENMGNFEPDAPWSWFFPGHGQRWCSLAQNPQARAGPGDRVPGAAAGGARTLFCLGRGGLAA